MTLVTRMVAVIAAGSLLLVAGCGGGRISTAEAVKFNDTLVNFNKRLLDSVKQFGESAGKAIGGDPVELARAKARYENALDTLESVKSEVRTIKVPNSASARKFHEEYQRLLQSQEQMFRDDLSSIVKLLGDSRENPRIRLRKIADIAQYLDFMDGRSSGPVQDAQRAFANEHGFQLK